MTVNVKYNITINDGTNQSVTVFTEGHEPLVASAEHPNFRGIVEALRDHTTEHFGTRFDLYQDVQELFAVDKLIVRKMGDQGLSERVAIHKGQLTLDRDPINGLIADHIIKLVTAGEMVAPVVRFLEKVATNLQQESRDQLYKWLAAAGLTLCEDGDFIGYKGVHRRSSAKAGAAQYLSSSSGHAYVNGIEHRGQIPTGPNTVVEMPRSEVTFDPNVSCSKGLHVGIFSYAGTFGNVRVAVKVNPRDVVSVPNNEHQKMRVCRYMVLQEVAVPMESYDPSTLVAKIKVDIGTSDARNAATKAKTKPVSKAKAKPVIKAKPVTTKKAAKPKKIAAGYEANEKLPEFYEDFKLPHFARLSVEDLRWILAQWEVTVPKRIVRQALVALASTTAMTRRRIMKAQQAK